LLLKEDKTNFYAQQIVDYDTAFKTVEVFHDAVLAEDGITVLEEAYSTFEYVDGCPTYEEYKNETQVITPATYYTYLEYLDITLDTPLDEITYNENPMVKAAEVTELVRPYVPKTILDTDIDSHLSIIDEYKTYQERQKNNSKKHIVVEHNTVNYQGDPSSINFMSAVGAIGAMRMFQALIVAGVITQEQYDAVYKTTENWKSADDTIHTVQIESVVEACEKAMIEIAKVIGAK
jgi:hypothetical protein